tara:strand:+ start:403 stop:570 length:168 start_codon:yes stop_codon:yes gene_type:complete
MTTSEDEWPGIDDDCVMGYKYNEDDAWLARHMNEHGPTAEGQEFLGDKDSQGDFV